MIEYKIPLWGIIVFIVVNVCSFGWWLIKLHFSVLNQKTKIEAMETEHKEAITKVQLENAELKKEFKELREILLLVKNNVDLLILGRLKTGPNERSGQ